MKEGNVLVQCRFDLTDPEVAAAARKRAAIEVEIAKVESAFNVEREKHKKALGTLEGQAGALADLIRKGYELRDVEIAKVESAFNVEREKHKKALGTLEGQAGALADLIRKGYELRDAECRIEFDYDKDEVCTIRVDTGEVVKTRPMTEGERAKGPLLPLGPAIALDESDPDAQGPKDCSSCGHLRVYHEESGCIQPDCDCKVFATYSVEEAPAPERRRARLDDVCLCGDLRSDHRDASGCDACDCTEFRDSDPLGVAGADPQAEGREAGDATP